MFTQALAGFQKEFFSGLNRFAEPLIRAGLGNPVLWPTGTIVVETTGRTSGRQIHIPVLATRIGELVVFSTLRRDSQWVKNLSATPEVRYWLAGRAHDATAFVFTPEGAPLTGDWPRRAECLVHFLQSWSRLSGITFALLTLRSAR